MHRPQRLRRRALDKLAALSAQTLVPGDTHSDISKLCKSCPPVNGNANGALNGQPSGMSNTGRIPMNLRELEVLLALCDAAPSIRDPASADRLLQQITPYVSECCYQAIRPSPFLHELRPSPWEVLTNKLTGSLLRVGLRHPLLRDTVNEAISGYIDNCSRFASFFALRKSGNDTNASVGERELLGICTLTASLIGFLDAASTSAAFWTPEERHDLVQDLQSIFSEDYLVAVETAFSTLRNATAAAGDLKDWRHYVKHYASLGRPLGAMLLRQYFVKMRMLFAALLVLPSDKVREEDIVSVLMTVSVKQLRNQNQGNEMLIENLASMASREIVQLEEGSDYLRLGSAWQQRMANSVRASSLVTYLCCSLANEDFADPELLMTWLEACLADSTQVADAKLASIVLESMTVMAASSPAIASNLCRSIPRFLVGGTLPAETSKVAASCLLSVLKLLSQDTIITTLYSLGNSLSARNKTDLQAMNTLSNDARLMENGIRDMDGWPAAGSTLNLVDNQSDHDSSVANSVIYAIVTVAKGVGDETITALALSMLVQKVGKVSLTVDLKIIVEAAVLATVGGANDFRALLRLYLRLGQQAAVQNDAPMLRAVSEARDFLSTNLKGGTPLYDVYLQHLLETTISKGDTPQQSGGQKTDTESTAQEMSLLLRPLALLTACNVSTEGIMDVESFPGLQRDAWYNLAVHGFSYISPIGKKCREELQVLAHYGHPLIADERADRQESDVELNTILRRGLSSENMERLQKELTEMLPQCESDIKSLKYPELVFLKAAHLIETLRASSGDCTKILKYFVDPKLRGTHLGKCMSAVAVAAVDKYLSSTMVGNRELFTAPYVAQQLGIILEGCCHSVAAVQQVAYACAERIITQIPSALCHRTSLFTLLDLLTIMWESCLEGETDEYEWRTTQTSRSGTVTVQLSDDYSFRRSTLRTIHRKAREWVARATNIAPLDVKGLLQTYLSDYGDDEAFGHLSLGRSFAFEMGAMIPSSDQRLGAIEAEDQLHINTASDFMAQYTTRQEYRYTDSTTIHGDNEIKYLTLSPGSKQDARQPNILKTLTELERRLMSHQVVSITELRDTLRRAATVLCRLGGGANTILALFVRIPFLAFSKQAIKVGLSLWIGVVKENPRMESRMLIEIIECWIWTVNAKKGMFSEAIQHLDPFYVKEEFAPSDKEAIERQVQRVHDHIAPHFRVLQFLASHYTATRLSSISVEKAYFRLLRSTLRSLRHTKAHPLAREVHFHVLLLGLRILRFNTSLSTVVQWRFKDDILSAGLAWFAHAPRWSFGGNRLQLKAETHILCDVASAMESVTHVGARALGSLKSLHSKEQLLHALITNEHTRLTVWLYPLEHGTHHAEAQSLRHFSDDLVSGMVPIAWEDNPAIAIHMVQRFQSHKIVDAVRAHLLAEPEKALREPEALHTLLGSSLPNDVSSQLKYLTYWAPVNPITAVTYFLPAFRNQPSIIQYAVRALDSHSVDVTFFYVPQIVQTLRYDTLGYVERYIIETAKFSQLFAHQIIWNMKANAYKDEDATIPDSIKPVLDNVMDSLISSFSKTDREFYEREFTFFNEITGISGKLRPFIKKSKPEKKQKIEEELRKIKVDVGVYLPSNPDGVVVGIDRKSGKPLQSHAKAPFMATFRIQRERRDDLEAEEEKLAAVNKTDGDAIVAAGSPGALSKGKNPAAGRPAPTFEVWQSAIFKVGDDCRQDVLALQMIAAFRGIFHSVGLPVYVFPYRVTATAPGCGVIDVLPNSISRDMLGREAVNGLYEWFVSKFGGEDAPAFQVARANFVKSLAAYSVISFLLQFKDRHNGNIMFDDNGHILHIDFGFCFDIAPGGVKFERAPFKLTKEMVAVMGGGTHTQSFRWFEELCVKAFLAARPFAAPLADIVATMLDSGLPCFKPETVQHFRERFVLEKGDREAAEFMRGLVGKSYGSLTSLSTKGYDQFQYRTNGIPY